MESTGSPQPVAAPAASPPPERQPPPAPSPANVAPAPSSSASASAEERLLALQEKMSIWKTAAAEQLKEAAAKNRALREELKSLRAGAERDLTDLRLQLTREFKERTALLQEEAAALHAKVATLREEKTALATAHAAELQAAEARGREGGRADSEENRSAAEEKLRAELGRLRVELEDKDRQVSHAEHAAELLRVRLERLGEQYGELSALIQVDGETAAAQGTGNGGLARSVNDAAHQQQLEAVRSELASKEQQALRRFERARAEHEQERRQLMGELRARDERLAVLQELLRQSQVELSSSQQRISRAQAETQQLEQHYAAKVASLSTELAGQLELLEAAEQTQAELGRQLRIATENITSLEADAASREEALHALMLSEDDKLLVHKLEAATNAAREECEEWRLRYYQLQDSGPHGGHRREGQVGEGRSRAGADEGAEVARLRELESREAQLTAEAQRLEERAEALRVAEVKLNEIKRSVAHQASLVLTSGRSGVSHSSNGYSNGDGVGTAGAGGGGGGVSSRWAATLRRPTLYFDSLSAERGWAGGARHLLRWAVPTRARMMVIAGALMTVALLLMLSTAKHAQPYSASRYNNRVDAWQHKPAHIERE